jgi:diguanylate cyclase (GGDEF)-like protein
MDERAAVIASQGLRDRLIWLLDSLSALRMLTTIGHSCHNESELLAHALRILLQNQDVDRCSIFLVEDGQLRCATGMDWQQFNGSEGYEVRPSTHAFDLGEGIVGIAAKTGALIHVADCHADARYKRFESSQTEPQGSLLACPIGSGTQVLGVLNVYYPRRHFFSSWHPHIFTIFANVVGQLLAHYRLLTKLETQVGQRTEQLTAALREAQQLRVRYEQLSIVDDLTGLHNRRFFFPETTAELSRAARNHEPFGLMLMDIDHFKQINDTHGHAAGDQVLKDVAQCLKQQTRDGDILARFGGEEFVLALPTTEVDGIGQLANRIREAIANLSWVFEGQEINISLSIGIAYLSILDQIERRAHHGKSTLDELLVQADAALYQCKEAGRNQVRFYSAPEA